MVRTQCPSSIPGQGTMILQATGHSQKKLLKLSWLKSSYRFFLKRQERKLLVHFYLYQNPREGAGNISMVANKVLKLLVNKIKVV